MVSKEISTNSLNLPILNEEDIKLLDNGEHIQKQLRDGRSGTGWVVVSVDSSPDLVFSKLADFMRLVIYNKIVDLATYR